MAGSQRKNRNLSGAAAYGVNIYAQDDLYLVPMQTLSAFTLASSYAGLYYNQQCLIISTIGNMKNIWWIRMPITMIKSDSASIPA